MITKEEVKQIINKPKPSYEDKISVITRYIFDLKQEDITVVKINPPQNDVMEAIMEHMFEQAKNYYKYGNI